jgi:hypothetical protein
LKALSRTDRHDEHVPALTGRQGLLRRTGVVCGPGRTTNADRGNDRQQDNGKWSWRNVKRAAHPFTSC